MKQLGLLYLMFVFCIACGANPLGKQDKTGQQNNSGVACQGENCGIIQGYDMQGNLMDCDTNWNEGGLACTEVFTPGDQYNLDCRQAGFQSTQCGCHFYVCSQKLP